MKAAVIYNAMKLQPTVFTVSVQLAMVCTKCFTPDESNDKTIQKRVLREAERKETREAAALHFAAAAQAQLRTATASNANSDANAETEATTAATEAVIVTPPPKQTKKKRKAKKQLLPGQKKVIRTPKQVQQQRTNEEIERQRINQAHIKACLKYAEERKKENGMSEKRLLTCSMLSTM